MGDASVQKLLESASACLNAYEVEKRHDGKSFNVFEAAGIEHREVSTCSFLSAILKPNGSHGMGILPLQSFCRDVLHLSDIDSAEYTRAVVETEVAIDDDRRIDILIRVGKQFIPIEVKIYASDQPSQCRDYYQYALQIDKETVLYYLTLDGHKPSKESRHGLELGSQYRCISFADDIYNWISNLLELQSNRKESGVYSILQQYLLTVEHLTNHQAREVVKMIEGLICSKETFRAANAIEKSLPKIKADMMCKFFSALKKQIATYAPDLRLAYEGFEDQAESYYAQHTSTWPRLDYYLPPLPGYEAEALVLRIEIDWNLYYGVCNLDDSKKVNLHEAGNHLREAILAASGNKERKKATGAFYWWDYLSGASDLIDFRTCNDGYAELYDKEGFEDTVCRIARNICGFLEIWRKNCNFIQKESASELV